MSNDEGGNGSSGIERAGQEKLIQLCSLEMWRKERDVQMSLRFQVADVHKPLIAVKRIVENGNKVGFGPGSEDNFILNEASGNKMILKSNGKGSYIMVVQFEGGEKTEITVDSGAEENVCPWNWGEQFGMRDPKVWMKFRDASGNDIPHHGEREVLVKSTF